MDTSSSMGHRVPITDDALRTLAGLEYPVRQLVVSWLEGYMKSQGVASVSLSDVSVAIDKVFTALDNAVTFDTGEVPNAGDLITNGEVTTLKDFLNERNMAQSHTEQAV